MDPEKQLLELMQRYPEMDPVQAVNIVLGKEAAPVGNQLDDFLSGLINNVVGIPAGIASTLKDPIGAAKAWGSHMKERAGKIGEATSHGEVAMRGMALPFDALGIPLSEGVEKIAGKQYGAGAADILTGPAIALTTKGMGAGARAIGRRMPAPVKAAGAKVASSGGAAVDRFGELLELAKQSKAAPQPKPQGFGSILDWPKQLQAGRAAEAASLKKVPPGFNPETMPPARQGFFTDASTVPGEYPTGIGAAPRYSFVDDAFNPEAMPPAASVPVQIHDLAKKRLIEELLKGK